MKNYIYKTGKRKEAVARVRLYQELKETLVLGEKHVKKGETFVNGDSIENYFRGIVAKAHFEEPFKITNNLGKYTITAVVEGGGQKSQLDAFIHGVSRALASIDDKNKSILKKKGFLSRDSRIRQRRNVGMGGKSRRKRQSPKR
jgi:small subunit ribosomal protein S9